MKKIIHSLHTTLVPGLVVALVVRSEWPNLHLLFALIPWICLLLLDLLSTQPANLDTTESSETPAQPKLSEQPEKCWLLDTSSLIDGRVVGLARHGLAPDLIYIAEPVVSELHFLSDRSSKARRGRGRRGLQMASELAKLVNVVQPQLAKPDDKEVDEWLISAAESLNAVLVSVDRALLDRGRVAGCEILSVHELARELQSNAVPGEQMELGIVKAGEDKTQGVGYLADGTMVVVDNARAHIGKTVRIKITSSIKTRNGPLIFAKFDGEVQSEEKDATQAGAGTDKVSK